MRPDDPGWDEDDDDGTLNVRMTMHLRNDDMIRARKRLGLSQNGLAKKAKVPILAVIELEKLKYRNSNLLNHAMKIACFLEIPLEKIMPEGASTKIQSKFVMTRKMHHRALPTPRQHKEPLSELPSPEQSASRSEAIDLVNEAMESLSFVQRESLKGTMEGKTSEQIAAKIGRCRQTVGPSVDKALRKLRRKLKDVDVEIL